MESSYCIVFSDDEFVTVEVRVFTKASLSKLGKRAYSVKLTNGSLSVTKQDARQPSRSPLEHTDRRTSVETERDTKDGTIASTKSKSAKKKYTRKQKDEHKKKRASEPASDRSPPSAARVPSDAPTARQAKPEAPKASSATHGDTATANEAVKEIQPPKQASKTLIGDAFSLDLPALHPTDEKKADTVASPPTAASKAPSASSTGTPSPARSEVSRSSTPQSAASGLSSAHVFFQAIAKRPVDEVIAERKALEYPSGTGERLDVSNVPTFDFKMSSTDRRLMCRSMTDKLRGYAFSGMHPRVLPDRGVVVMVDAEGMYRARDGTSVPDESNAHFMTLEQAIMYGTPCTDGV